VPKNRDQRIGLNGSVKTELLPYSYCMVYDMQRGGRGGGRILRKSCNNIAIVWAMQMSGNKRM